MQPILPKALTSKYLIISVFVLFFYTLVGFVVAPLVIRWYLPKYTVQNLHCRAGVDTIRINPFLLTIEVKGFLLNQTDESPLVAVERFFVDLEMSSLFHWAVVLRDLEVDKPDIRIAVEADGSINFDKLAATPPQPPESTTAATQSLPFMLQRATIRGGRVAVVDKRQSTPAEFSLQGIELQALDMATAKDHPGTYHLAATTEEGESLQVEGDIAFAPLRTTGKLALKDLRIAGLWKFCGDSTNLEQPAGQVSVATEYSITAENSPVQMTLQGLHVSFADLELKLLKSDNALLQLKKLDMEAPRFETANKELHVRRLLLEEGAVDARIVETGGVNLQQIVRASPPDKPQRQEAARAGVPPSNSASPAGPDPKSAATYATDAPFRVRADAIELKHMAVTLDDRSRVTPFKAAIAAVNLHLQADLELGADTNKMVLGAISSELKGIQVHTAQSPEPLFATDTLTIAGGTCDLGAQTIAVDRIALAKGRFDAGRDKEGNINWQRLVQTKGAADRSTKAGPASAADPGWKFLVKSFEVDGFSSKFSDLTTQSARPVLSLQNFKARLNGVDGTSPMGFTMDFQVDQGGTAAVSGTINPTLPSLDAEIQVSSLVLTPLQPYIEPYVTLQLQSASVTAQGRLRYGIPGTAPQASYEGNFRLNDLRLTDPKSPKKSYLSWDAVQLPQCTLTLQPNGFNAREIRISKPVGELIIEEDKTLNLAKVLKNKADDKKPQPPSKPAPKNAGQKKDQVAFPYAIEKLRVENGNMVFADLSLRPRFMTRIHDLKGTVTGLSSAQDAHARIQMNGRVDQYGTAKINGVIHTNDFARSSDIELVFRNLEMKNLSPYSGRFAGRLIKSGKVSADLQYKLQNYTMVGDNKITIDNLSLGDKVDDPNATNLPLDLAIALLKDSSGRIDIGLPVTGDLNDPQFSMGSLVWKMFTNLITSAVSAPFRALGSLFGSGEEKFDAVAFDPGSADLLPPEKEKLLKLADALKSRPQLKLVIQGRYSPDADGMEFKERSIRRRVATRLGAKIGPNDTPELLEFNDSSTRDTLETLYKERLGKASFDELEKGIDEGRVTPRLPERYQGESDKEGGLFSKMAEGLKIYKLIPGGKSREQGVLWAGELYTRLVENEKVADEVLLQLAENRAQSIAANMEGEAQVPKDRVRIKAAEPLSDSEQPSVSLSLDAL